MRTRKSDASERGARIGLQRLNSRFLAYRNELGLDEGLDFHSLRRSYVTHLIEDGWDPRFVQEQIGHDHASITAIYTCVWARVRGSPASPGAAGPR
ncbi:tyrosine-type recombinase/integrase [Spirillospora sp. CA-108201]